MGKPQTSGLRWLRSLVRAGEVSSTARNVGFTAGLLYMNWQTLGDIRPGVPRLAADTHLSERTVKRCLAELVDAGYLVKVKRGHTGSATLYRASFPKTAAAERRELDKRAKPKTADEEVRRPCVMCTELAENGSHYCAEHGRFLA